MRTKRSWYCLIEINTLILCAVQTPPPLIRRLRATFSQDPGDGKLLVLPAYLYSEFYITQ